MDWSDWFMLLNQELSESCFIKKKKKREESSFFLIKKKSQTNYYHLYFSMCASMI